jgi:hypothetical protein
MSIQWAVAYGGPDPDSCAGLRVFDDEAEAFEESQWMIDSSVWLRVVAHGAWVEAPHSLGDGGDGDDVRSLRAALARRDAAIQAALRALDGIDDVWPKYISASIREAITTEMERP